MIYILKLNKEQIMTFSLNQFFKFIEQEIHILCIWDEQKDLTLKSKQFHVKVH